MQSCKAVLGLSFFLIFLFFYIVYVAVSFSQGHFFLKDRKVSVCASSTGSLRMVALAMNSNSSVLQVASVGFCLTWSQPDHRWGGPTDLTVWCWQLHLLNSSFIWGKSHLPHQISQLATNNCQVITVLKSVGKLVPRIVSFYVICLRSFVSLGSISIILLSVCKIWPHLCFILLKF